MTNSFKSLTMEELANNVCVDRRTLIVFHARPDADAVGSAFALRELLSLMGIPAICACVDDVPERLLFLADGVQGSVVPEEGMPLDHERVISVDSASPSQLGELYNRLHKDIDLMIDHHATGTAYANNYIDPEASATGEIIYLLGKTLLKMGNIPELTPRFFNLVYAAICSDTGCFKYANATPRTFRIAAELIEAGVNKLTITKKLFEEKSPKQIRAEGEAARRLNLYDDGIIASVTFPYSVKESMELSEEHLETIIDIPRSVAGAEVAFVVKQPEDKPVFRVSMRSSSDFNVADICAAFGGGGHVRAAGCTLRAIDIREAEKQILTAVRKSMNAQKKYRA